MELSTLRFGNPLMAGVIFILKMDTTPILLARNLGKKLSSSWIWQNLSFEIQAGAKVAVAGPSGSGKSLLLRVLAGLEDTEEGQLYFDGQPLSNWQMPPYRSQ